MPSAQRIYRQFYLQGRDEIDHEGIDLGTVDLKPTIDKVMDSPSMSLGDGTSSVLHKEVYALTVTLMAPKWNSDRAEYVDDNKEEIAAAGGDAKLAFAEYMYGRTDAVARQLEDQVLELAFDEFEEGEEDDDDEDEDADDDEDDEVDDDSDDDDEEEAD